MYPSKDARELAILLRISRELDIVGDVTATVDNPSELLAWAHVLTGAPTGAAITAWLAEDSGHRYLQVTADHPRAPIRGRVAAVLPCETHPEFWHALNLDDLEPGHARTLTTRDLSDAWATMPVTPADIDIEPPAPPSRAEPPSSPRRPPQRRPRRRPRTSDEAAS